MSKQKEQTILKSTGEEVYPLPRQKGQDPQLICIFKPCNQIVLCGNRRGDSLGYILYVRPDSLTTLQKAD